MRLNWLMICIFALALTTQGPAEAAAITVTAQGSDGFQGFTTSWTLPTDPSQGYGWSLYSTGYGGGVFANPNLRNTGINFRLSFGEEGSNVPLADQPSLLITGQTQGGADRSKETGNYTASFAGTGTIAQILNLEPGRPGSRRLSSISF